MACLGVLGLSWVHLYLLLSRSEENQGLLSNGPRTEILSSMAALRGERNLLMDWTRLEFSHSGLKKASWGAWRQLSWTAGRVNFLSLDWGLTWSLAQGYNESWRNCSENVMMWKVLLTKKHSTVYELRGEPRVRLHRKWEERQAKMEKER